MPAFIVVRSEQLSVLAIDTEELTTAMQRLHELGVGCSHASLFQFTMPTNSTNVQPQLMQP